MREPQLIIATGTSFSNGSNLANKSIASFIRILTIKGVNIEYVLKYGFDSSIEASKSE
jgi:phosphate/sulfate permease